MKQFVIMLCFCLMLLSCISETKIAETINLNVIPYNGTKIDVDKYISVDDTTVLYIGDNVISYNVRDACMDDSTIYVLDDQNNIMAFDLGSGLMKCSVNKKGHGRGEYVKPVSISISDDILYVLDFSQEAILQYNKKMEFIKKIKIEFSILDFLKIDGGFVFYDISPNKGLSVAVADENGVVKNRYTFNTEDFPEIMLSGKVFVRTDRGIFFHDMISDTLYELIDNGVNPIAQIKDDNSDNKDYKMYRCFPLTNIIVTYYESDRHVIGNIFDKQTNKSICGKFKSPHAYPIFPCIEKNTFLYGIYHQHDDKNQYILVKYRVND